ncbi:BON domain-containing protein [Burkholderia cenocepacia]|uniref:BON domain-containing protein n=1 Tax=Burkholderia cenocepacia TaxID=95486 RepID=UPI000F59E252|nr:BON domain-containing protein [Burkholderia cenocepacia]RQU02046.1 BON domain-containing protein [Burkholderia cenocepacia]RQU57973.1 BON domain-containing protein [Burkholderia cenocepacia]
MKTRHVLLSLHAVAVLLIAANTYAQAGQVASDVPQTASALSKKEMKAENRRLQRAVVRALGSAKGLNSANIGVVARQGAVVLRGSVTDAAQSQIATAVASSVSGVTTVTNNLLVRPE